MKANLPIVAERAGTWTSGDQNVVEDGTKPGKPTR